MAKRTKDEAGMQPNNTLAVEQEAGETGARAMARKLLEPQARHAVAAGSFASALLGKDHEGPGIMDYVEHMRSVTDKAEGGDLSMASRMLAAQAITLDSMFTEFARRAALNMGEYIGASETYGRMALKAQSNCRSTLDTLAKLHQPREQTVRHVHVNEGGQAVIADQFHHHAGGQRNAETDNQSHATGAAGTCTPLPCPDANGNGVPVTGSKGAAALPDARRHKSRRT